MLKGKKKRLNFKEFETYKFNFKVNDSYESLGGCGGHALYQLTGRPPSEIKRLSKDGHWSTKTMFSYLKKHGYEIYPVTLGNIVEVYRDFNDKPQKVSMNNVLLIDQKCFRYENTWAIQYHNIEAHSGEIDLIDPIGYINYPPHAIYLIWHKKWVK